MKELKSLKIFEEYLLVCYGDTIIDINLNQYIKFYLKNFKKIVVASYQLESSFGVFDIKKKNIITNFQEKPLLDIWFNVGYIFFHLVILNFLINLKISRFNKIFIKKKLYENFQTLW